MANGLSVASVTTGNLLQRFRDVFSSPLSRSRTRRKQYTVIEQNTNTNSHSKRLLRTAVQYQVAMIRTTNPIRSLIICDWEAEATPTVLVCPKEHRMVAEIGAHMMHVQPPEEHGRVDHALVSGIQETQWNDSRIVYGQDFDSVGK